MSTESKTICDVCGAIIENPASRFIINITQGRPAVLFYNQLNPAGYPGYYDHPANIDVCAPCSEELGLTKAASTQPITVPQTSSFRALLRKFLK